MWCHSNIFIIGRLFCRYLNREGIYLLTKSDFCAIIIEAYNHAWDEHRKKQGRVSSNLGDVIELSSMDCGGL